MTWQRVWSYWAGPVQYGSAFVLAVLFFFVFNAMNTLKFAVVAGLLSLLFFRTAAWRIKRNESRSSGGSRKSRT